MPRPGRAAFLSHLDFNLYRFRLPLMRALVSRGWEVFALSPEGRFSGRFAAEGVRHVPYRIERSSLNPLKEAAVVVALGRILSALKPDLLHCFTMKPNIYGSLATLFGRPPKIVASVTGLGGFYTGDRRGLAAAGRAGLDLLYSGAMRRVDRVICYNDYDARELLRRGIARDGLCRIVPGSGVDTGYFTPRAGPRPEGPVKVAMIARLIKDKGVDEYLSAAETLAERGRGRAAFRLAGDFDEGNPWSVDKERLADCEARGIVSRLGFVEDVLPLLRQADVYVLPSYREGMPVSVLEAMSCGLPVVTTDAPGCRDAVVPGESGLLVPARDAPALTEALERLIAEPDLRLRLGAAARRRAVEVFSSERITAAHLEIYRELLPSLL